MHLPIYFVSLDVSYSDHGKLPAAVRYVAIPDLSAGDDPSRLRRVRPDAPVLESGQDVRAIGGEGDAGAARLSDVQQLDPDPEGRGQRPKADAIGTTGAEETVQTSEGEGGCCNNDLVSDSAATPHSPWEREVRNGLVVAGGELRAVEGEDVELVDVARGGADEEGGGVQATDGSHASLEGGGPQLERRGFQ